MLRNKHLAVSLVILCLIGGCGHRDGNAGAPSEKKSALVPRAFPQSASAPAMYTAQEEKIRYIIDHYWDGFLDPDDVWPCDSTMVNGVGNEDFESAFGMYVTLLTNFTTGEEGRKSISSLFDRTTRFQKAAASSSVFAKMAEMVGKYLYDPNSPVRDEDLYYPYVSRLAKSPFVDEGMKTVYANDARMCSMNRVGTRAADFSFMDKNDRLYSLRAVKSPVTLLMFTNPGCENCSKSIKTMKGDPNIDRLISEKKLAVVNVYIDLERDKWKALCSEYPETWINGYDHQFKIRQDLSYNVRAIPSFYLLDKDKTVIMKDAPLEKVLKYIDNL